MPVGDACKVESFFYGDFRGRECAEGLLDGVVIGEVLPEECLASGSGPAWGGVEVYWGGPAFPQLWGAFQCLGRFR